MDRTTICLDEPLMKRVRERARREKQTLKKTITEVIALGLARAESQKQAKPKLGTLNLGRELMSVDSRARLYEEWEKER